MPAISPNTPAAPSYAISASKALVVNSQLDIGDFPRTFTVSYPDPAPPGIALQLVRVSGADTVDLEALATAGTVDTASIPGRGVSATRTAGGGLTQIVCNIDDQTGLGQLDEHYEVHASATTAVNWTYAVDNAVNSNVIRVICDPVAAYNGLPATLLEKQLLTVTAEGAAGPALTPTIVRNTIPANGLVLPAPVPTYQFGHEGAIAITGLPSPVGTSQTYQLADRCRSRWTSCTRAPASPRP